MTTKTLIIDTLTNEYYCVPMSETDRNGNLTTGPNDFPYWSVNESEAHNFSGGHISGKNAAEIEMQYNDLTRDGSRKPTIIEKIGE